MSLLNVFDNTVLSLPKNVLYVNNIAEAKENMCMRMGLNEIFPAKDPYQIFRENKGHVFVGGGASLDAIHKKPLSKDSDIDFFVLEDEGDVNNTRAINVLRYLTNLAYSDTLNCGDKNNSPVRIYYGTRNNLISVWFTRIKRLVQIIVLPGVKSLEQLLNDFDHSACAIAFDGEHFWATIDAINSYQTRISTVKQSRLEALRQYNPDKAEYVLQKRIQKMKQKGFEVIIPATETNCLAGVSTQNKLKEREVRPIYFPNETFPTKINMHYLSVAYDEVEDKPYAFFYSLEFLEKMIKMRQLDDGGFYRKKTWLDNPNHLEDKQTKAAIKLGLAVKPIKRKRADSDILSDISKATLDLTQIRATYKRAKIFTIEKLTALTAELTNN